MTLQELFSSQDKWTQGAPARDKKGQSKPVEASEACSWCLLGGLILLYRNPIDREPVQNRVRKHIYRLYGYDDIVIFNDDEETTFEMVRKVVTDLNL